MNQACDNDGLDDLWEIQHGLSPVFGTQKPTVQSSPFPPPVGQRSHYNASTAFVDAGDRTSSAAGLQNYTTRTDQAPDTGTVDFGYHYPLFVDSDGDGIPDWWELKFGLNPNIAGDLHGSVGDPDGDGLSNLQEYYARSNPLRGTTENLAGGYKRQTMASTLANKAYDVYYRPNSSSQWRRISSGVLGQKAFTFVNPSSSNEGDYVFLDAADDDGDGLSNGYEDWFTYGSQTIWLNESGKRVFDLGVGRVIGVCRLIRGRRGE